MMNELDRDGQQNSAGDKHQQTYLKELLLALRMRGVPGPRIAETLAEVNSHLSETGEAPQEAFGPAKSYADEVVAALGAEETPAPFWRTALSWTSLLSGLGGALGGWLVINGALAWAEDERGPGDLPAAVTLAAGLAILLALTVGLVRLTRNSADRVLDPRSGADMAPLPRWAVPLMISVPLLTLVLAVVIGLAAR